MYKYYFHLDSETKTPDLEAYATNTDTYTPTYRRYQFGHPSVVGGALINDYIEHIKTTCKEYKLIIIGEDKGHMEIYNSENYNGEMKVIMVAGSKVIEELWK